jgi:hypothetical protein
VYIKESGTPTKLRSERRRLTPRVHALPRLSGRSSRAPGGLRYMEVAPVRPPAEGRLLERPAASFSFARTSSRSRWPPAAP